jgi:hypothetical protein
MKTKNIIAILSFLVALPIATGFNYSKAFLWDDFDNINKADATLTPELYSEVMFLVSKGLLLPSDLRQAASPTGELTWDAYLSLWKLAATRMPTNHPNG